MKGYAYALIIVDDASMYQWVYGLKEKSDANAVAGKWIYTKADLKMDL